MFSFDRLCTILAIACATGCAPAAYVVKNDLAAAAMQGSPSLMREIFYDAPRDRDSLTETLGEFDLYTEIAYNRAGNIVRMDSFRGPDSVRLAGEDNSYDPSGTRLERSTLRNRGGRARQSVLHNYDSAGRLVSEIESMGVSRSHISYDRRGFPRTGIDSAIFNKRPSITLYRYDRRGRLRNERDVGPSKTGGAKEKGPVRRFKRRYFYRPDGTLSKIRTGPTEIDLYDERGLLTSQISIVTKRDGEEGRRRGRYLVTLKAKYDGFDAYGNWTRRTQIFEGRIQSVTVRRIEYFED